MKKVLYYLPSIIFNAVEVLLIALIGTQLKTPIILVIIIFAIFAIGRINFGSSMHYKDWKKCMLWSSLVFASFFLLSRANILICLALTTFASYILTSAGNVKGKRLLLPPGRKVEEKKTKGDITDIFMWSKISKYVDIDEFIKYNLYDDKLIEFQNKIKVQNNLDYLIFKYRFIENMTFEEMSEKLDMPTPRISEKIDKIAFAIRLYCGI